MKGLTRLGFALMIFSITLAAHAQNNEKETLGTLIYFEGEVKVSKNDTLKDAAINQKVGEGDLIRTGNEATAEIRWNGGIKTVIGPNSEQDIASLFNSVDEDLKSNTQNIWSDFRNLFTSKSSETTQEEGGIRRSKAEVDEAAAPNELYWKKIEEVSYADAANEYNNENYVKSIKLFETYLEQKPNAENVNFALFALGHSYVELNNIEKAEEVFQKLENDFPDDPLAVKAEQFLNSIR